MDYKGGYHLNGRLAAGLRAAVWRHRSKSVRVGFGLLPAALSVTKAQLSKVYTRK